MEKEIDIYKFTGQYWHRNFLVMGIPRSGTSLFCNLLNMVNNVYCFSEVWYDIESVIDAIVW